MGENAETLLFNNRLEVGYEEEIDGMNLVTEGMVCQQWEGMRGGQLYVKGRYRLQFYR